MAANAKKIYDEFNPKLVRNLPLKDPYFIAELTRQHLFSGVLKEEVMAASTEADATTRFLYKAIERSLDIDNKEPFDKLLEVMEKFDNLTLNSLAKEIKQELTPSTIPKPKPKPSLKPKPKLKNNDTSGEYYMKCYNHLPAAA